MRTYFIDYSQIWIPSKGRWDKSVLLKVQNDINMTLFDDSIKAMALIGLIIL